MSASLRQRLTAPTTLVVGKGGVGKSTTAAALALAFADAGDATHLISTDPAHSLADVLAGPGGAEPRPSRCSPLLVVEEYDARAHARRWVEQASGPLTELVERGTFLDDEDVRTFIELTLPGVDEVMAALRLAELRAVHPGRIVVDAAPTGHTLRLLGAGAVVRSWIAAFRAMADKAGTVAEALVRRRVRFAAEDVLDDLEASVKRFDEAVIAAADAIVVSRPEPVVAAETGRLEARLRERGVRVTRLQVGGCEEGEGAFCVPLIPDPRGCEGLRRWTAAVRATAAVTGGGGRERRPAAARSTADVSPARDAARRPAGEVGAGEEVRTLLRREIVFVAGKGGVGKSTCAAAAAAALAEERDVVLVSTDPAGSLTEVLGMPVGREAVQVAPRLRARQVDAAAEFSEFRESYRAEILHLFTALGLEESAVLDRRVMESLWDLAPPGLDEIFALSALIDDAPRGGTLVVDSAPTGHFLRLLEMPELARQWTRALLRVLVKSGSALRLDGTAESVLRFAKQLKDLKLRLADPDRAGTLVVTLDETVVRSETDRLAVALETAGFPRAALLVNRSDLAARTARSEDRAAADEPGSADPGPVLLAPEATGHLQGTDRLRVFFSQWRRVS